LRERARKLDQGILIVRFEMPYNVWCEGCNEHIGKGVRFNAEKKQFGNYFSTKIWQFRMKCHLCSNWMEIHTDPKVGMLVMKLNFSEFRFCLYLGC
jgi:coiled-coil domain-containing protein 130